MQERSAVRWVGCSAVLERSIRPKGRTIERSWRATFRFFFSTNFPFPPLSCKAEIELFESCPVPQDSGHKDFVLPS